MNRLFLITGLLAVLLAGCRRHKPETAMPPLRVGVAEAVTDSVPNRMEFIGYLASNFDAVIQPRVNGYLLTKQFANGMPVKRGQLLFTIDPDQLSTSMLAAEAALQSARAQAIEARNNYDRAVPLARINAISQSQLDQYTAQYKAAEATVRSAEQTLSSARMNVGYTELRSPIDGIISNTSAHVGDYVGPGTQFGVLTTISNIDTLTVDVAIPMAQYLRSAGPRTSIFDNAGLLTDIRLMLADGTEYPYEGLYDYTRKDVSSTTGTLVLVVMFPNPDRSLKPGQFARVEASVGPVPPRVGGPQGGAATVDATTHVTRAGGWVVASETCALDIVGAEYVRDVRPGEILRISAEGLVSEQGVPAAEEPANCIFEQVYFARPDSIMNGKSVYACRYDMGRQLAHEEPVEADLVIGVPDSGLPPAEGYSHESGIPFGEGLIKNRYVGRTFIEPTQELRAMGVRMKLNPLRDNIEGKRLVVIDDSIVRGTTMVQLVKMLRNAGAKEIHIRINSPEVIWPCFYGIDTDVQSQLISANKTVDEICEYIGADSLAFLSVEGLLKVMPKGGYCDACFTGRYPVAIPESFGRDKFMEGFKPRNLDKPLHFDDDAVVEKYDDRSWEEEHGEA